MRRPRARLVLLTGIGVFVMCVVVALVVVVISRGGGSPVDGSDAPPAPATLEQLRRAEVSVRRAAFCDRVEPSRLEEALGETASETRAYVNGDRAPLGGTDEDVAHEYGCIVSSATGDGARAWVFAPPVTPGRAKRLARLAGRAPGCVIGSRDTFGRPGVATTCTDTDTVTSAHQGLFGDSWLTCEVTSPASEVGGGADLTARSEAWCVAVALAAAEPD